MKRIRFLPKQLQVNTPLVSAVLCPVILVAAVLGFTCAVFGLYPFGDGSLCWCDMRQQGLPLLMMLRNALLSGDSLSYMPGLTGGTNFSGIAAFFLMNPGSLLSMFWKPEHLLNLLNLLVFGKLLLCAATAGWFFFRRFKTNGIAASTAFATAYALCGYGLLYYQNLMWLDVMAVFPLFLLSCYALLERGRILPYTVCMAGSMMLCFYIGFMVAVFALLFFGVHLWLCCENRRKLALQFLGGSVVAAMLSAPVWLPAFVQVLHSARSTYLSDSLSTGSWGIPFATALPLLLCSAGLPLLLIVTAIFSPKWNRKTLSLAVLLGLLLIPMCIEPVNLMWHMGSYMCFPCRFAFMPILLMLTLLAHLWTQASPSLRGNHPTRRIVFALCGIAVAAVGFGLYRIFTKNSEALTRYIRTLWSDAAALKVQLLVFAIVALICALIALLFYGGLLNKRCVAVLLCGVVLCESTFHCAVYIGKVPDYWQFGSFENIVDMANRTETSTFTRTKTTHDILDSNMVSAIGYPTLGGYTSLVTQDTLYTAKKLGYTANWMDIGLNGGTRFSDMLLSVGYTIDRAASPWLSNPVLYSNDDYRLESLPNTLPLGLLIDEATATRVTELGGPSRLQVQETLAAELFGESNLFTRYQPAFSQNCTFSENSSGGAAYTITSDSPAIVYSFYVQDEQSLYFDCFDEYTTKVKEPVFNNFSVAVNGMTVSENYPNAHESGFLSLGVFENETVTLTLTPLKSGACKSFGVFGLRNHNLATLAANANTANITYNGHDFVGTFIADADDCLVLTIPYDSGFTAIVDGHRREILKTMDNFMRIPLESGESAIKLTYTPKGKIGGYLLFFLGILILVLGHFMRQRLFAFFKAHTTLLKNGITAAYILTLVGCIGCVVTVYLFPIVYKIFT